MYDVAIIGAGVIGSAIARELSRYQANVCVIEREEDVCDGTSKANSAIIHAGFDAAPGSLKAKLNVRGNEMMDALSKDLDIPFKRNGSLVVCTKDQDRSGLDALLEKGEKNGVPGLRILEREELLQMEPNLSDDVTCGLYAPTGGIVCPFGLTFALAENAAKNGVQFRFDTKVTGLHPLDGGGTGWAVETDHGTLETRCIVNAAGVYADTLHNMADAAHPMTITARRGDYFLLDHTAGQHVRHTVFQLPGKYGKGILVTPTVHGNTLIGPTADDHAEKQTTNTTRQGLDHVCSAARRSVPSVPVRQVITSFAGNRAHEDNHEFIIEELADAPHFVDCSGIESPGLTSSPAIGERVAQIVFGLLHAQKNPAWNGSRKGVLNPKTLSEEDYAALIRENPAYGNIICRCEMITEGEILDAIHRPLGARSLDGVKRRTRAGMGRCQAGFCSPRTMEILARELGISQLEITKNGGSSNMVVGLSKDRT